MKKMTRLPHRRLHHWSSKTTRRKFPLQYWIQGLTLGTIVILLLILAIEAPYSSISSACFSSADDDDNKLPQLLGIMIAGKADVFSISDWLFRHHRLFDKLAIVDGSKSNYIEGLAQNYKNVAVLKEENFNLTIISDQTLRAPAMTVLGNPIGSWIMICHADEFWTIDPRRVVMENEREQAWTSSRRQFNILRFKVVTASPYESRYKQEIENIKNDPSYWQDGRFHIMQVSNMSHGLKSTSSLVRNYMESRIFKWQDGMAWGTRNSLVVPEHIPMGQKIRYYGDAFFVHFKLHDFSPDGGYEGDSGSFKNSNLQTRVYDERAEGWMGTFLDISYPEKVVQFPPRSIESAVLERCLEFGNRRWPCELGWNINASFT